MAVRNRIGAIAGAGLAVSLTVAVGAGIPQAAAAPSPVARNAVSAEQDLFQQCPRETDSYPAGCIFGINEAQTFTGPNQLGPAPAYTLANRNNQWTFGCLSSSNPRPFPLSFPANSTSVSIFSELLGCDNGNGQIIARAEWNPPAPLPQGDITAAHLNNMWSNGFPSGPASFWCAQSRFTQCDVFHTNQAERPKTAGIGNIMTPSFVYRIRNLPFIVEINNNLPAADNDDLIMDGSPQVSQFIMDPAGGNPQTIKAGESGYFGLYATTQVGTTDLGFSVAYNVSPSSTDIAGSSVSLDVVIDPKTGSLDKSSKCTFNVSQQNQAGTCSISLVGGPRAVQILVVNVYE